MNLGINMKKIFVLLCAATSISLAACSSTQPKQQKTSQMDDKVLTAYVWHLNKVFQPTKGKVDKEKLTDITPAHILPFDLVFADNRLSVQGLCNQLSASYTLDGHHIDVHPMMGTKMMCDNESLMKTENFVGQVMPEASQWAVRGLNNQASNKSERLLNLSFDDGMLWQFIGTPTPETKYGQVGVTAFLEVDPSGQPCADHSPHCLRVRSLEYNEQGIRTKVGPWQIIDRDQLQGFELEPNVQSIIRVKRFMEKVGSGQHRAIYIYDMTVESKQL